MIEMERMTLIPAMCRSGAVVLAGCLLLGGVAAAQSLSAGGSTPAAQLPDAPSMRLNLQFTPAHQSPKIETQARSESRDGVFYARSSGPVATAAGTRVITLAEAQQIAAVSNNNPLLRLGQLQVEVARQTRLGTESSFFPQIGSTFSNFHFNKFMGQQLLIRRPLAGATATLGLPLLGQNQTLVAVTATQPITPLFQLRELYKINLADERIAETKAGMPISETASKVEKAYYELLVAQRQLAFIKEEATERENKWLVASNAAIPVAPASHEEELIETGNTLAIALTKVQESQAALDDVLGLPPDTELQLVPPDPRFENISLREATEKALAANPEVIEAEQNVVKARAASTLQKLAYVPVVAVMGGYAYQNNVIPLLPRDFSFVGGNGGDCAAVDEG